MQRNGRWRIKRFIVVVDAILRRTVRPYKPLQFVSATGGKAVEGFHVLPIGIDAGIAPRATVVNVEARKG
jgi:hypothetical protein